MTGKRPGPMPKSAEVIALHGNPGKHSAAELEARAAVPKARPLRPDPPKHLSTFARECWDKHAPELEHLGLLTVLDAGAFELACESYALAREALEELRPRRRDGEPDGRTNRRTVVDVDRVHGGSLKKHPAFSVWNMATNTYRAWCQEFGLTPSARLNLRPGRAEGGSGVDGDEDDDAFFGT